MKVFVAGATGALGAQLVPQLLDAGHTVTAMTRTPSKRDAIRALGAQPVVADALDADAVRRAVRDAQPDAIVHQLTALPDEFNPRTIERDFAQTNLLRTKGTDNLLAAGRAVGTKRFVAQSFTSWPYARTGSAVKTEEDPLDPTPAAALRPTLDAIRYLERSVTEAEWTAGIVLRYGGFYGPGTSFAPGETMMEQIRRRKFPVVGDGGGIWSFIHIADAAAATVAAVEHGAPGIYNIVDDEPAPVAEWLPVAAEVAGGKPPRHVPLWLGRLIAGEAAVVMMTDIRGASNAKAKRELAWTPAHSSWREGFAA